uniref:Alternative protein INO80D n=1 Tax=Homo sapiens TaxID=9606 RepID=L8E8T9_HUMAN|nr:alternative protein INO80D [Homo sapiens]
MEAIMIVSMCRLPTVTISPLPTQHRTLVIIWQLPFQQRCPSWRSTCSQPNLRCHLEAW